MFSRSDMKRAESGAAKAATTKGAVSPAASGNGPTPDHVLLYAQLSVWSGSVSLQRAMHSLVTGLHWSKKSVSGPVPAPGGLFV